MRSQSPLHHLHAMLVAGNLQAALMVGDYSQITGYCLDAPELMPAGATFALVTSRHRNQPTVESFSRRWMAGINRGDL